MLLVFDCNSKEIGRHPKGERGLGYITDSRRESDEAPLFIQLLYTPEDQHGEAPSLRRISNTDISDHYYRY